MMYTRIDNILREMRVKVWKFIFDMYKTYAEKAILLFKMLMYLAT
jgi:hypothetical protein